ncbi:AFR502Cp [Eremothecium gossypii ATCC 10895]|uniref:Transcription initiation factor IIF subunit beta n=1 Tax=Eremothecium gossypii (strain ATCC 10895 / CBS 109.51 / FGSC 9923 / NRRL Y-1056) TaxID=284811 RepID=Q752S1_EREGS|nr:AFR502Cp [Eremothecium gossypii ATCC 10895]AAS53873.1 AFR502Cp [Eremothecium gossypii ATCC 10895]AEY98186.1 FAFR502Cp [Eremothecium gossypii FDAG1]
MSILNRRSDSGAQGSSQGKTTAVAGHDSGDEYLSQGEEVFDGNDIENNERKIYEESLDLDLSTSDRRIWLVRLPKFLAEKWRDPRNLNGQELGKIRINKRDQSIQLLLNEDKENAEIPHEYDLELTKKQVQNEYIFTEQNLKKYQQREQELAADPEKQKQAFLRKQEREEELKKRQQQMRRRYNSKKKFQNRVMTDRDGRDRYIPYVKTIPKKTAVTGTVCHECQLIPSIDDPNYHKIVEQRRQIVRNIHKPTVTVLDETPGVTMSNAGLSMRSDTSKFLKVGKERKNNQRAIRMPKKELLDYLFKLFDEYDYWSLKGLKERTRQPEAYLKESLDQVALLVKKGPYALKYTLKTEYKKLKEAERSARLGELAGADDQDGGSPDGSGHPRNQDEQDEGEEDVEMEDIL